MIYRSLSRIYPKKLRENYMQLLKYARIKTDHEIYLGFTIIIGVLVSIAGTFFIGMFYTGIPFWALLPLLFITLEILMYVPLMLKVDKDAREIETMLPDALQLMSSNLKSGLTIDQALLSSVRAEFGIFARELNQIGKEIAIGKSIEKALIDSTTRVKSEKYSKTMDLLTSGLRSGGELSKLLDQTSANLKHQDLVDQKVRSNVMMYVIFIFFAICFGAPILYGLSSFLVDVINNLFGNIDIPTTASSRISIPIIQFSGSSLTTGFITTFIVVSIIVSSIMGGLIIGLISRGKEKEGLKYIPLIIAAALAVFFIVRAIIAGLMGTFIDI